MITSVRRSARALAAAALVTAALALAVPAVGATGSVVLASGLSAPSGLAVGDDGSVYVSRLLPGALLEVSTGSAVTVATSSSVVTGVDSRGSQTVILTRSRAEGSGRLSEIRPDGRATLIADLGAHEAADNPDQLNIYGFQDLDDECADSVPSTSALPGGGRPYTGDVDSNVSAVAILPDGSRVVADERGNHIARVDRRGETSTVAVLPPVAVEVTPTIAAARGLPGCTVGETLHLEPSPTDVELGPDGLLYVSSMPAAPGSGSTVPDGSVFAVDPETGGVERVASGFRGAKDLAVAPDGTIYVAELFGGQISVANEGSPITFRLASRPSAIEYADDALYAAVGFSFGPPTGQVVTIFLR